MRIINFGVRPDELEYFEHFAAKFGVECFTTSQPLDMTTIDLLDGMDGVTDITTRCYDQVIYERMQQQGIRYFSLRQAGFDGLNCELGYDHDVRFARVPDYSPNAISEHSVALALMLLRNLQLGCLRWQNNDYRLENLIGREIRDFTVGILGTGHIGLEAARAFQGFGGRVIAYDVAPLEEERQWLEYVDNLDDFLKQANLIGIYMPLNKGSRHLINSQTIAKLPRGSVIINVARGEIVNTRDLYDALLSGRLSGAALDVIEGEKNIFQRDLSGAIIEDELFRKLKSLPNVIITPHIAFNTNHAVRNMVKISLENIINMTKYDKIKNEIPY
ncbi:MAG: NAD(P)-dependent oxidoreductase [Candidatus Saccharibacteria bacterium]|nr:NAD(P)-dependent oxidoreductase [Candidatus Saccharibacteria bacterium]